METCIPRPPKVSFSYGIKFKAHDSMMYLKSSCRWGHLDAKDREQLFLIQRTDELKREVICLPSMNMHWWQKNRVTTMDTPTEKEENQKTNGNHWSMSILNSSQAYVVGEQKTVLHWGPVLLPDSGYSLFRLLNLSSPSEIFFLFN